MEAGFSLWIEGSKVPWLWLPFCKTLEDQDHDWHEQRPDLEVGGGCQQRALDVALDVFGAGNRLAGDHL